MKKILLNWRYYIIFTLFTFGFLFTIASFGDPVKEMSLTSEMFLRLVYFGLGLGFFWVMAQCVKHWEANDEIPEFTKAGEEEDDEWE